MRTEPDGGHDAELGPRRFEPARPSLIWNRVFRLSYWVITRLGWLVRWWMRRFGLGNVVDFVVVGRRTGRPRPVLLGLLRADGRWYLGHPNGAVNWTRNLEAAGVGLLAVRGTPPMEVRAVLLPHGAERDRAIAATWRQHVFPGRVLYWLARRHIRAIGRFYRLEPGPSDRGAGDAPAEQ